MSAGVVFATHLADPIPIKQEATHGLRLTVTVSTYTRTHIQI